MGSAAAFQYFFAFVDADSCQVRSASELVIVSSCMPECHAVTVCIEAGTCSMVACSDDPVDAIHCSLSRQCAS